MGFSTLLQSDILNSREVQFASRQEPLFPHLLRLSLDFNFRVLEILKNTSDQANQYVLVADDYRQPDSETITPAFSSMALLNNHVGEHMIDILHDYLFGLPEEHEEANQNYA